MLSSIVKLERTLMNELNKKTSWQSSIFIMSLIASATYNFHEPMRLVGVFFVTIILAQTLVRFFYNIIHGRLSLFLVILVLPLLSIHFLHLAIDLSTDGAKKTIMLLLLFLFFLTCSKVNFETACFPLLGILMFTFSVVLFLPLCFGENFFDVGYTSYFQNSTSLGIFALLLMQLCFLFYTFSKKRIFVITAFIFLCLLILSRVRTAALGLIVFSALLAVPFKKFRHSWLTIFFPFFPMLFVFSFLIFVLNLREISEVLNLNQLAYELTGKPILSGREFAWAQWLNVWQEKPILGHGLNVVTRFIIPGQNSPHNSFINLILETGLFGGCLFLLLIYFAALKLHIYCNDTVVHLCLIFTYVNFFVLASFEVLLTQGQFGMSLIIWFILGIGINRANSLRKT